MPPQKEVPKMRKANAAVQQKPHGHPFKLLGRLLSYLFHYYKGRMIAVFVCIAVTAAAGISSSVFLQLVLAEVITPLTEGGAVWEDVSGSLFWIISGMGAMYIVALAASVFYNQTMAIVTQGFLRHVRDDMFSDMQALPIRYFDTHTHGDIMSVYTNDTDALRQLISMSIPQVFYSIIAGCCLSFCSVSPSWRSWQSSSAAAAPATSCASRKSSARRRATSKR